MLIRPARWVSLRSTHPTDCRTLLGPIRPSGKIRPICFAASRASALRSPQITCAKIEICREESRHVSAFKITRRKYLSFLFSEIDDSPLHPASMEEGRVANVTKREAGCGGRGGIEDGRCGRGRRSRVVLARPCRR